MSLHLPVLFPLSDLASRVSSSPRDEPLFPTVLENHCTSLYTHLTKGSFTTNTVKVLIRISYHRLTLTDPSQVLLSSEQRYVLYRRFV